ncbi:thyrotropin-releasing hormone receptor-like [Acanthaster planci]|uniref:Thyrotropin-releasing hormone receptor-like n=1 Tax=Acanthaster planci TaxID=133434 RepID=A0A8B7XVY8_ACAPL|nr:thyrotropin-releasing hormone receptor-like [Acanthaster planci]
MFQLLKKERVEEGDSAKEILREGESKTMGSSISPGLVCDPTSSWNFTNDEESAKGQLYSAADSIIVPILMSVIVVVGLLTNSLFLLSVIRVQHMRTATNHYLVQIAVADIMYLVSAAGDKIIRFAASPVRWDRRWSGGAGCVLTPLLVSLGYFAVLFFMTLVTREKYLAVCKPLKYRAINAGRRIRTTLAAWAVAFLITSSFIPSSCVFTPRCITWPAVWRRSDLPSVAATCSAVYDWWIIYTDIMQTTPFFLVTLLTLCMYVCIARALRVQVAAQTEGLQGPVTARKMQTRRQIIHMLVCNGLLFICLLAPFECVSLVSSIWDYIPHPLLTSEQLWLLSQIARTLAYLQAAINPLVYYMLHPRYRHACLETFSRGGTSSRQDVDTKAHRSHFTLRPKNNANPREKHLDILKQRPKHPV